MTEQPDLELPDRVPEMAQYHDSPMRLLPFAFYTLSKIDHRRLEAYRRTCITGLDSDRVQLPSRWNFHDESLRVIVKYHVELGQQGAFDPTYFIVSAYPDCSTVVLVSLDDDDMVCKPDLLWAPMDQSGLLCNNLQIGNSDWFEAKESDLRGPQSSQPGPSATQHKGNDVEFTAAIPAHQETGTPPPVGFHVQLYVVDGLDEEKLLLEIQPGPETHKRDPGQHICKTHHLPVVEGRHSARTAADLHPSRCLQHPTLQKHYFLIADSPDFNECGVQIVHIDWDGVVNGRTSEELLDTGRNAEIQTQRAEVSAIAKRAAVPTVLMMAQGYQPWAPKHKLFAVYSGDYGDSDIHLPGAIDPAWAKRGHGQDRVVFGGFLTALEREGPPFWRRLMEKHIACCRARRFVPNFVHQCLIWCDGQPVTADSRVVLVKLDWDGDASSTELLLMRAMSKISTLLIAARDAHATLSDVTEGRKTWNGQPLSTSDETSP